MSQKLKDVVNDINGDVNAEIDGAKRDINNATNAMEAERQAALSDLRKAGENATNTQLNNAGIAESIGSKGYNSVPQTNNNTSGANSGVTRGKGLDSPNNGLADTPREEAPDIGKDYGDSQDPTSNGYNPEGHSNVPVSTENQVDRSVPNEAGGAGKTTQSDQSGEKKSNDLNEIDKEKERKEKQDAAKKEAGTQPATEAPKVNPDAKGGQPGTKKNNEPDEASSGGNGYGALKKPNPGQKGTPTTNDATKNARKNLNHNSQSSGTKLNKPNGLGRTGLGSKPGLIGSIGNTIRHGFKKNLFGKGKNEVSDGNGPGDKSAKNSFLSNMGKKAMGSLLSNPYVLIALGVVIIFIFIILATLDDELAGGENGRGKRSCNYDLAGITSTGNVQLNNVKVEIVNCDAKKDDYRVLETVDFEKYILGVALAEAGPSSPDEALKAQMIAVRNFSLTRNRGMCPSNPDNCFHGYNASTGIIRMRACTNDQVYWDYDKDIYQQTRSGKPSLYSPEVNSGHLWKAALSEERKTQVEALASSVMGEVLLDTSGNVLQLGYQSDETTEFINLANEGKTYKEILQQVYGASNFSSAECKYGNFDYGDYELTSDGTTILHEPLDGFLEKNGTSLEEFNELIASNVEDAGYGTRAGVVAAAVTLIAELGNNYGVKVPYYWGGGHYDGVVVGALGYWGSTECHTYANNQSYDYCGFDCSGFVPWAIKNGGFNKGVGLASDFQYMTGARKIRLTNSPVMQPGDLLESDSHVILIVGIDEEAGQYICAEAMGNAYGTLFTRRSFTENGYWGVDLEDYYNNPSNVRSQ